jgi:amino acid transporter
VQPRDTAPTAASPPPLPVKVALPETVTYRIKRLLLGPPLTSAQLPQERLGKIAALGVLAPDMISSSAYGTEEMLVILVPFIGLAAFTLVLPVTYSILAILVLVTLSYREVVTVYTKAGGSYVVARDNFGPRVAQVAAVALMVDYTLTVAVQVAAATDNLATAVPFFARDHRILYVSLIGVAVLCYGNLRGIREAGSTFAFPTYFYVASLGVTLVVGIVESAFGHLTVYSTHRSGLVPFGHPGTGLLAGASLFIILRAFANGGSSLTGLEAVSNTVSAFRPPQGRNARRVLVVMCTLLGLLVLGVSWLAHVTHAAPYTHGAPTVVGQIAKDVWGPGAGQIGFYCVQAATMLILYTGGNTSFNGFPFLASFVAEDSFLPRLLTHRGHRLTFSNGILVLTGLAIALLVATNADLNSLIGLYAIGVFTGFTMAGAGLVRYHLRTHEPGWRRRSIINGSAAVVSAIVVVIFAITKFTQGAWVVVVLFPVLTYALIRLNRRYRDEERALGKWRERGVSLATQRNFPRHVVLVLVDNLDLATLRALRYARSLRPTELRAVHFMIDSDRAAELQQRWRETAGDMNLEVVDCPDRRLVRAAMELAVRTAADPDTAVTFLLPRRSYGALVGRLLHDRTADRIAEHVSQIPRVAATIVPFDPTLAFRQVGGDDRTAPTLQTVHTQQPAPGGGVPPLRRRPARPAARTPRPDGSVPVAEVQWRERATVDGLVKSVETRPMSGTPVVEAVLADDSGGLRLVFYGRREVQGITPGVRIRASGRVCEHRGHLALMNPHYELLPADPAATREDKRDGR